MNVTRKKLIEAALPLPEINDASAYDKMPGIGPHPKGIHHWWARLPLPAARAILFASVVDDPEAHPEKWPTEEEQSIERERLFGIIRRLMGKRLHDSAGIYAEARVEMLKYCDGKLPAVFDPFSGGGSIPLEANRMGFEAHAGDLNPVAVLLNKCNLEIAPQWVDRPPVNPESRKKIAGTEGWRATQGISNDIQYYAQLIEQRAQSKVRSHYPDASMPQNQGGGRRPVIAWIWARTVASPNPAYQGKQVPLVSSFWLSTQKGNAAWLSPVVNKATGEYHFNIETGTPTDRKVIGAGTKVGRGGFRCLLSGDPIPFEYVRSEGRSGRIGFRLIATVVEGQRGRIYLPASAEQDAAAKADRPVNIPDTDLPAEALGFRIQNYGIRKHWMMFSNRQLLSLSTLCSEVREIRGQVANDARQSGMSEQEAEHYSKHVATFLSLCIDRCVDFNNSLCRWSASNQKVMNLFGRQAIPMIFDFAEANIFGSSVGSWRTCSDYVAKCVATITNGERRIGTARQVDAATGSNGIDHLLVSTDPPYYDNIGYAALSDVFYVWLRKTLADIYPELFATVLVPKLPELTAAPERFGGNKEKAKHHFESGFRSAFSALRTNMDPSFPLTVYYAFKQDDEEGDSDDAEVTVDLTTGWETLLEALFSSGFQITGTWPVRASQAWRMRSMGSNALASYIVLACRPRPDDAPRISRNQFRNELRQSLPSALRHLQQGNIAPVDLAQAILGPGMSVYTRYAQVLDVEGKRVSVREAIALISQVLDEVLAEEEVDFDTDSRWALAWFADHGFSEGPFGDAHTYFLRFNIAENTLKRAGIIESGRGKVRLLKPEELPTNWDPATDPRLTSWEVVHHLIRVLATSGESAAADLVAKLGARAETARELAYRLYTICERKKRAAEALAYNGLVQSWPEIVRLAQEGGKPATAEPDLFNAGER